MSEDAGARDKLAMVRTELANERTLLAYLRTGLALLIGAITAQQLIEDAGVRKLALAVGVLGVAALCVGILRFTLVKRRLQQHL